MARDEKPSVGFDFYGPQYARFASASAGEMRHEVYGEDIGQQGWRTVAEQAEIASLLRLGPETRLLDVGCGAGGPSLALVARTSCHLTGLDAEPAAISHAREQAAARGAADRASFSVFDCADRLPFADGSFDAVVSVDAVCHLPHRFATVADWGRVLREGGRLLFTDPAVLTGAVSRSELDARGSAAFFLVVAPGHNEKAIESAGLALLHSEDRTASVAEIAGRWHAARLRRAPALQEHEGAEWFDERQRFLAVAAELAGSRRLSRFLYLAEKPPSPRVQQSLSG
jgi:SAM-dependent methyltransferase